MHGPMYIKKSVLSHSHTEVPWTTTRWQQITLHRIVSQKHRWYIKDSTNWCVLGNYVKGWWALILQYNIHPYPFLGFQPNYGHHYESTLYIHTYSSGFHGNYIKGCQALISQYNIYTYTHTHTHIMWVSMLTTCATMEV